MKFRNIWLTALLAATLFTLIPAQAEVSWNQVKSKIKSAKNYTVTYKYDGPSGVYDMDYRWSPDKIRTEIVKSPKDRSKRGTVIVYDKSFSADKVRAKTGGGFIVRNLTHEDVKGKPFYQSLFGMILDQVSSLGQPKASKSGSNTLFSFSNGKYKVWADANGDIVKTKRKDGLVDETREFTTFKWNGSPDFSL